MQPESAPPFPTCSPAIINGSAHAAMLHSYHVFTALIAIVYAQTWFASHYEANGVVRPANRRRLQHIGRPVQHFSGPEFLAWHSMYRSSCE